MEMKKKLIKMIQIAKTYYLKEKFAFIQQERSSLANVTKKNLLKISTFFIFGY